MLRPSAPGREETLPATALVRLGRQRSRHVPEHFHVLGCVDELRVVGPHVHSAAGLAQGLAPRPHGVGCHPAVWFMVSLTGLPRPGAIPDSIEVLDSTVEDVHAEHY